MRIVVASDSFKGSLTSTQIVQLVREEVQQLHPEVEVVGVPMADGGEGTLEALQSAIGGVSRVARVTGPLGRPVDARWVLLSGSRAVIEMAAASGLPLVDVDALDPLRASSYGTGELVRSALDHGAREVTLAIGGSATNDGGMGFLSALGVRFLDRRGRRLLGCGSQLAAVASVDAAGIETRIARGALTVMCDVDNPLLGPNGATHTFGPQKGADDATLEVLERGMAHYASIVEATLGVSVAGQSGSGAAGGLGFALRAFFHARVVSGIEHVLDLVGFDELLAGADLCITGEGRLDCQSAHGKVVSGVASRCAAAKVPCIAVAGSIAHDFAPSGLGLADALATSPPDMDLTAAMAQAADLYRDSLRRLFARSL